MQLEVKLDMVAQKRDSNNKIYSRFAKRLGCIVEQYENLQIESAQKYETTLCVCVLQSLLTMFDELEAKNKDSFFDNSLPQWGLESSFVKVPSDYQESLGSVLSELRDSLSHPHPTSSNVGYTSIDIIESGQNKIGSYKFAHSGQKNKSFEMEIPTQNLRILITHLSEYLERAYE